jgi:long-chain acyl-CoA synthetase
MICPRSNRSVADAAQAPWTVATLLDDLAGRGDRPCLVAVAGEETRARSSGGTAAAALALARGLVRWGVRPGEAVALVAPAGPDWVVARLALGRAAALVVAIDDLAGDAEVAAILGDAACRRVLAAAPRAARLKALDPALEVVALDAAAPEGCTAWTALGNEAVAPLPPIGADDAAMLAYTSGTTGPPKSFVLTYAHLAANVRALVAERLVGPDDRVLMPLPLHHVYPLVVGLMVPLQAGAAVVFPEAVGGPQIARAIAAADVTAIVGVPRLYAALMTAVDERLAARGRVAGGLGAAALAASAWLARRFGMPAGGLLLRPLRARLGSRLRLLVSGGARLDDDTLWRLAGLGFEVRCGYGLAETASSFTANLPGRERLGSEGRPFQGGEVRIAGADATGEGEIELRGPCVFSGYRRNADATRAAFSAGGWFRTGDLGRLDAEGFLHVTGRIKEALVLGGGRKVHPEELERAYASPFIREMAVIERDGRLVALVVPDLDALARAGNPQIEDAVRVALGSAAQALPAYQRLAGFAIAREPLPRTRLGKYQRFRLAALYDRARAGAAAPPPAPHPEDGELLNSPTARAVLALLRERYPGRPVGLDANPLLDLGIDSLEWVALGIVVEQRLGVRLPPAAGAAPSVRELVRLAAASPAAKAAPGRAMAGAPARGPPRSAIARLAGNGLALAVYALDWLAMRTLFPVAVEGRQNLPAEGPFILVANHASYLDPPVLAAAIGLPRLRRVHWAGAASVLFGRRALDPVWRALKVFPVDEREPAQALSTARALLARGECVVWFPEAWRTPDGNLQRFQPGIGVLAAGSAAPVVPAFIAGTFEALPRTRRLPRPHAVRVVIGRPLAAGAGWPADAPPAAIAERLHDAVAALAAQG